MPLSESEWLQELAQHQTRAAEFFAKNPAEQHRLGYFHTLREICQQPATWIQTCEMMQLWISPLRKCTKGIRSVILTGSGSSEYAGACVALPLQCELEMGVQALSGGSVLTLGGKSLPPGRPALMVSLARSGDSPESVGALAQMLKTEPEIRHLVLTCNSAGGLATTFRNDPRVTVITLDEATNDKSLVMTSSFTNLVMALRFLGLLDDPARYHALCERSSAVASQVIGRYFDTLALVAKTPFKRAVFLGSGARFGATREAALKMLEMTAGRVTTLCETYLGLRHGPMSYVHEDCLIVAFLSSEPSLRAYESDLLQELDRKNLGLLKVMVGEDVPRNLVRKDDVVIECKGMRDLKDDNSPLIDVLVGQLLAFFRCLEEGFLPDSPSRNGIISRVVQSFTLHLPAADHHQP